MANYCFSKKIMLKKFILKIMLLKKITFWRRAFKFFGVRIKCSTLCFMKEEIVSYQMIHKLLV